MASSTTTSISSNSTPTSASSQYEDGTQKSAKKPYKRIITEKRRQQNRDSQKKYRERIKTRLEELETQVASTERPNEVNGLVTPPISDPAAFRSAWENGLVEEDQAADWDPRYASTNPDGGAVNIDLNFAFEAAGDLSLAPDADLGFASFQYPNSLPIRPSPIQAKAVLPNTTDQIITPPYSPEDFVLPPDPGSPNLRGFWPVSPIARIRDYTPPPHLFTPTISYASLRSSSYTSSASTDLSLSPHHHYINHRSPSNTLPDPRLNTLLISGERCMHATFTIATSLSISQTAYINDHPSPLYQPPTTTTPLTVTYTHLPKALRPTPTQLSLPHPSYLDCIIFPSFRSRAIALSARGELDHCALFVDLLGDGLVCWGNSGATRGGKGGADMRDGVAWSTRSWEARPWFLRRWWMLVGVEEGDGMGDEKGVVRDEDGIWEQSRWFWRMRGELGTDEDGGFVEGEEEEYPGPSDEEIRRLGMEMGM